MGRTGEEGKAAAGWMRAAGREEAAKLPSPWPGAALMGKQLHTARVRRLIRSLSC